MYTVGWQIAEAVQAHHNGHVEEADAMDRAVDLLELVGIPNPESRVEATTRTSSPAACASGP